MEIIVCPARNFNELNADILSVLGSEFREVLVSTCSPQTRSEFSAWGNLWPINFRPTENDRERELGVSAENTDLFNHYMGIVFELESKFKNLYGKESFGALIVDPTSNKIIMGVIEAMELHFRDFQSYQHPLITPTMLCINGVSDKLRLSSPGIYHTLT